MITLNCSTLVWLLAFLGLETLSNGNSEQRDPIVIIPSVEDIIFSSKYPLHQSTEVAFVDQQELLNGNTIIVSSTSLLDFRNSPSIIFHVYTKQDISMVFRLLQNEGINGIVKSPIFIQCADFKNNTNMIHEDIIKELLTDSPRLQVRLDQEMFISLQIHDNETFTSTKIWEVYSYKNNLFLQEVDIQKTQVSYGPYYMEPISVRRGDLRQISLTVVAQNDPDYQPRIQTKIYPNGTTEFVGGMCLDVLNLMQDMLRFRFKALDGQGWLGLYPNGTWTGMSGQIVRGEADLSISQASTIMMTDQVHGISFLHPTSTGKLVAIFRQPRLSSIRNVISSAFQPFAWLSIVIMWIVILICVKLFFHALWYEHLLDYEVDSAFVHTSFLWSISATCGTGWHLTPRSFSLRIIFGVGTMHAFFILMAYSASLVMNLSTETLPIRSYQDLVQSSIGILSDKWLPMAHTEMMTMYDQRGQNISNPESYYRQLESIIPAVLNRTWTFITFGDAISVVFHRLNYSDTFYCDNVYEVVVSKLPYRNAMYVKKDSPLREILNTRILLMVERGFLSRLNRIYDLQTKVRCPYQIHTYRGGLALRDTVTPLLFIVAGHAVSLFVLALEQCTGSIRLIRVSLLQRLV